MDAVGKDRCLNLRCYFLGNGLIIFKLDFCNGAAPVVSALFGRTYIPFLDPFAQIPEQTFVGGIQNVLIFVFTDLTFNTAGDGGNSKVCPTLEGRNGRINRVGFILQQITQEVMNYPVGSTVKAVGGILRGSQEGDILI